MSKKVERAQFRGELLAEQRAQTAALRRIAAALERVVTVEEIERGRRGD